MNDKQCIICYDDLVKDGTLADCGHSFCKVCLDSQILATLHDVTCPADMKHIHFVQYHDYSTENFHQKDILSVVEDIFNEWRSELIMCFYHDFFDITSSFIKFKQMFANFTEKNVEFVFNSEIRTLLKQYRSTIVTRINKTQVSRENDRSLSQSFMKYFIEKDVRNRAILSTIYIITLLREELLFDDIFDNIMFDLNLLLKIKYEECEDRIEEIFHSWKNLTESNKILYNHIFLIRSVFLQMKILDETSNIYESDVNNCLICSTSLLGYDSVNIDYCNHSVCKSCVQRFTIISTKCVHQCDVSDTFVTLPIIEQYNPSILKNDINTVLTKMAELYIDISVTYKGLILDLNKRYALLSLNMTFFKRELSYMTIIIRDFVHNARTKIVPNIYTCSETYLRVMSLKYLGDNRNNIIEEYFTKYVNLNIYDFISVICDDLEVVSSQFETIELCNYQESKEKVEQISNSYHYESKKIAIAISTCVIELSSYNDPEFECAIVTLITSMAQIYSQIN